MGVIRAGARRGTAVLVVGRAEVADPAAAELRARGRRAAPLLVSMTAPRCRVAARWGYRRSYRRADVARAPGPSENASHKNASKNKASTRKKGKGKQ